jgi:hypothetical protein
MSGIVPCHPMLEGRWIDGSVGALAGWIMGFTSLMALRCSSIEKVQGIYVYVFLGVLGTLTAVPPPLLPLRGSAIRTDDTSARGHFSNTLGSLQTSSSICLVWAYRPPSFVSRASSSFSLEVQKTCLGAHSSPCYWSFYPSSLIPIHAALPIGLEPIVQVPFIEM